MLYNKTNLLLHQITSDNSRPELNGVLFKKDSTIATDSYILIEVKNQNEDLKISDYPIIEEKLISDNFPNKGFLIPANSVKKAMSNLSECKNATLPILSNAVLASTGKADTIKICSTNLEKADIVKTHLIEDEYPNYKQIIPQNLDKAQKISIDIKKLKQLASLLSQMELKDNNKADIYFNGANNALIIKTENIHKQFITALLMPLRQ